MTSSFSCNHPHMVPQHVITTVISSFIQLGAPFSSKKTAGPSKSFGYLSITLITMSFQASLPTEMPQTISLYISNYLLARRCAMHQLFSLLLHLTYHIRMIRSIPQGCSFLSHLLSLCNSFFPPLLHCPE